MTNSFAAGTGRLLFMIAAGVLVLSVRGENSPSASQNTPQQSTQSAATPTPNIPEGKPKEIASDIWHEITLNSGQELKLTEKNVQQILEEIKKTDPQYAEQLTALRKSDLSKFVDAIREEIRKHTPPEKSTSQAKKEEPEWQDQLKSKHDRFLEWLEKGSPNDYKDLIKLRDTDPENYVQRTLDLMKIYEPIQRTELYSPPLAELMKQELELQKRQDNLLIQIRLAAKEQQKKLVEELKQLVSTQFDTIIMEKQLRCELLHKRMETLTQQLEDQAAELDALKKAKTQAVEDRTKELVQRSPNVGWE